MAYTVTTVAMLFTAYSYGRMVVLQPIAGSAYSYASRAFGRPIGFMVGWALLLDYIFLPMINYLVIGLYMEDYFPSIGQPVWIVLTVLIVTGLNILGIRLLAGMNFAFVGAQFVFIVVFAVLAIGDITGEVEVQSWTAPFVDSGTDFGAHLRGRRDPRAVLPRLRRRLDAVRGDGRPATRDPQGDPAVRAGGRSRLHLPVLPRRTSPSRTIGPSRITRTWPAPTSWRGSAATSSTRSSPPPTSPARSRARWPARRACRGSCSR